MKETHLPESQKREAVFICLSVAAVILCAALAFYFAREYYTIIRELPTGKGFADICFIPRKLYADKPAAVIELKWDKDAYGAISQIKEKQYVDALKDYHGNLLLAGINYDKKIKQHTCVIERYHKQ